MSVSKYQTHRWRTCRSCARTSSHSTSATANTQPVWHRRPTLVCQVRPMTVAIYSLLLQTKASILYAVPCLLIRKFRAYGLKRLHSTIVQSSQIKYHPPHNLSCRMLLLILNWHLGHSTTGSFPHLTSHAFRGRMQDHGPCHSLRRRLLLAVG